MEATTITRERAAGIEVRGPVRPLYDEILTAEALSFLAHKAARHEALSRAFRASGKSREEFAEMYGLSAAEVATLA